jgi:hypothetical protein
MEQNLKLQESEEALRRNLIVERLKVLEQEAAARHAAQISRPRFLNGSCKRVTA